MASQRKVTIRAISKTHPRPSRRASDKLTWRPAAPEAKKTRSPQAVVLYLRLQRAAVNLALIRTVTTGPLRPALGPRLLWPSAALPTAAGNSCNHRRMRRGLAGDGMAKRRSTLQKALLSPRRGRE